MLKVTIRAKNTKPFQSICHDGKIVLKKNAYVGTNDARMAERALRKLQSGITDVCQMFSIKPCYNASPDNVTMTHDVRSGGCYRLRGVHGGAVVPDVLGGVEHTECQTSQEVSGGQETSYRAQLKTCHTYKRYKVVSFF